MDGYPYQNHNPTPTPTAVSMGALVSTVMHVKTQVDFMDQYLSLYGPDYLHFKNYSIASQRNGVSVVPPPTASSFASSVGPPITTHPAPLPSFATGVNSAVGSQMIAANNMRNATFVFPPPEKTKARRKQSLLKNSGPAIVPAPPSRRGRKRKYPENPMPLLNNCQNVHVQTIRPNSQESIVKLPVRAPLSPDVTELTARNEAASSILSTGTTNGKKMTSLDILAAVSYVLKQNETASITRETLSNSTSGTPVTGNQEPQHYQVSEQLISTSTVHNPVYQKIQSQSSKQAEGQEDFPDKNGQDVNGSAERQRPQSSDSQVSHQLYETVRDEFRDDNGMFRARSPTSGNEVTRSQEERILGGSPDHEIVVISGDGGTSERS